MADEKIKQSDHPLLRYDPIIRRNFMDKKYIFDYRSPFYKKPDAVYTISKSNATIMASPQHTKKSLDYRENFGELSKSIKVSESILRYKVNRLSGYQPFNMVRSTYRAVWGWDISDNEIAEMIRKQASNLKLKNKNLAQLNDKALRAYKDVLDSKSAVRKRIGKKNYFKKLNSLNKNQLRSKAINKSVEALSSIKVLKGLNRFSNLVSVVNFFGDMDEYKDDKFKLVTNGVDAFKGAFDIANDSLPLAKKAALYLEKSTPRIGKIITQSRPMIGRISKFLTKPGIRFAGRVASRAAGVLSFAADISEVYKAKTDKEKAKKLGAALGGAGSALAGAKLGALAGTALGGPVGTVIGGVVGGAAGYFIGSGFTSKLASRYHRQVMKVWKPIETGTRYAWKAAKDAWNKNKANILKYAAGAGTSFLTGGIPGLAGYVTGKVAEKLVSKKLKTGIKKTITGALASLSHGPLGLLGYTTGSIAENFVSNALQKPKKSSSNPDLRPVNKVSSLHNVGNTDNTDCRQVAAQMIFELNKVLQNKVISHTANYA